MCIRDSLFYFAIRKIYIVDSKHPSIIEFREEILIKLFHCVSRRVDTKMKYDGIFIEKQSRIKIFKIERIFMGENKVESKVYQIWLSLIHI